MKRKIILSLLCLFLISATGAALTTLYISNTTAMLSRLVTLHQIEDLRQHLIISIQGVQSDLYTVHTQFGHTLDDIVEHVSKLDEAAAKCSGCHHEEDVTKSIQEVQKSVQLYQENLSYYITASANKERIDKQKSDAAALGNELLRKTEMMAVRANKKLEATTVEAMDKVKRARLILFVTMSITFILGAFVAIRLTRSVTDPIDTLLNATRMLKNGDLGHVITIQDTTEFGELAANFNSMSLALKENYERLLLEVSERTLAEEALRKSEERYALAARGANDGLWDWDVVNGTIYYSFRWKSMLGYEDDEIGSSLNEWFSRLHPDDRERVEAKITTLFGSQGTQFECEYRILHKDGTYRWILSRGLAVRDADGRAKRMAGSQTDISERKAVEAQLLYDALHDALTGLPNRALFMDRLEHVIASSRRRKDFFYGVLFIDLDRFKVINDSLGHNVGDKLLIEVGTRLKTCLRPGDTVARLGGDEFAILLEHIRDISEAEDVAQRIRKVLSAPHFIDGVEIFSSQSIGIALKSDRYDHPEQILRDSDIAMYEAKAKGRSRYEIFDTRMHTSIVERIQLESDLRLAIEHHQGFVMHYQPIMDLASHAIIGFEALVRWKHAIRDLIFPSEFIPLAEETGMIIPLTSWIMDESCRQLREWQLKYPSSPDLRMSVNISSRMLLQQGFVDTIETVLAEHNLAPGALAIEITENVLMEHSELALSTMEKLQTMGVHIHIDDFGTGYSSLSYLHNFPVNALKIDRSFIAKMSANDENQEIVKTIIALAQSLKLEVIAEGLEQVHQLSAVKEMECQYGQGFIFSEPLPADAMECWMAEECLNNAVEVSHQDEAAAN